MKIMIDAGHGPNTAVKRSPDGMREYEFNRQVAIYMKEELEKYDQVTVYFSHSDKQDVPLKKRTDQANRLKVDLFFSIHANAFQNKMGNHSGVETYVYTSKPSEALELARNLQRELVSISGLRNRGVKTANFHVLRETKMTAVLVEHGFMDSKIDLPKLKSTSFRKECGKTNARVVAKFYNLKLKKKSSDEKGKRNGSQAGEGSTLYKVQVGAFKNRSNAENLAKKLKEAGFSTYIVRNP